MIGKNFGKRLTRCANATRAWFFQGTALRSTAPVIARRILRSGQTDLNIAYPFAHGQSIRFLGIGALGWHDICRERSIKRPEHILRKGRHVD